MIFLQLYFLMLATNPIPSECLGGFFPPGLFSEDPADDRAAAAVASTYLCRLGEASLMTFSGRAESYRIIWLRPFDPVIVVRINNREDENCITAHVGVLPLGSGQVPEDTRVLHLGSEKWNELKGRILSSDFWGELQNRPTEAGLIAIDASQWIIEGYRPDSYKAVQRTPPEVGEDEKFIELAVALLKAGGIDVSGIRSR